MHLHNLCPNYGVHFIAVLAFLVPTVNNILIVTIDITTKQFYTVIVTKTLTIKENTMNDIQQIKHLVENYQNAIHTQDKPIFYSLWSSKEPVSLISISTCYNGLEAIYNDFLINAIQVKYESIHLIAKAINIRLINDQTALVIFDYQTQCILNSTHEPYGIEGVETQVVVKENNQWKLAHIHYSKA